MDSLSPLPSEPISSQTPSAGVSGSHVLRKPAANLFNPSNNPFIIIKSYLFNTYNFRTEFQRQIKDPLLPNWCMILDSRTVTCLRMAELVLNKRLKENVDVERLHYLINAVCSEVLYEEVVAATLAYFARGRRRKYTDFLLRLSNGVDTEAAFETKDEDRVRFGGCLQIGQTESDK
ncbi:hypothetical protein Ahia01_001366200 [Argonauta hians]